MYADVLMRHMVINTLPVPDTNTPAGVCVRENETKSEAGQEDGYSLPLTWIWLRIPACS